MKIFLKFVLAAAVLLLCGILIANGIFLYTSEWKISPVDTSISPDDTYQLKLLAIGEPDWPFGAASGRLTLSSGKNVIAKYDFRIHDDGAPIGPGSWQVAWQEEQVQVILSGSEQADEQVILSFDGKVVSTY